MTRVDVERIRAHMDALAAFDRLDLSRVELYEGGEPVALDPGRLESFRHLGQPNRVLVEMRYWDAPDEAALRAAARSLGEYLRPSPEADHWVQGICTRFRSLAVMMQREPPHDVVIPDTWEGFAVETVRVGRLRLCGDGGGRG
jgi:hypothetical protein